MNIKLQILECQSISVPHLRLPTSSFQVAAASWTSQPMIYAAALLCDLGTRPIHTAPVTAPLPACLLRTKPSVQNGNFTSHPEIFLKKKGKKKRIQSIQRQNLENYMICRAGAAGLGAPLTRELNCTHRRPQHLSFVGMQPFFSRYFCNSLQRKPSRW